MEAGLKKKISQFIILGKFWSKIWSGGIWNERSLFLQEERCRLLGKDFVLKPNPVLIFINVFLILAIIFDVILNIFLFSGKE